MNRTLSKFTTVLALTVIGLATVASAQNGFNTYDISRTTVITTPKSLTGTSSNYVDVAGSLGIAKVSFMVLSNASAGALTITLASSPDLTNWTTLGSCSIPTSTAIIQTNTLYISSANTNPITCTNTYLLPGVVTTPTASSAGWASSYLLPAPYTNSGAITSFSATGAYEVGFNIQDCGRYLAVAYTGSTNHTVSAILTARKAYWP